MARLYARPCPAGAPRRAPVAAPLAAPLAACVAAVVTATAAAAGAAAQQPAGAPPPPQQPVQGPQLPENFVDVRAGTLVIVPIRSADGLPAAGYDKSPTNGAFVQSADGQLRLQLGGYTQLRWNLNSRTAPTGPDPEFGDDDTTTGASVNRTRLFLEGKYTDDLAFHLRTSTSGSFGTELLVAWGQWRIDDRWSLRFGKQFIPLSREDWMFAQDTLTIEFSPNDFTYAIGPSLGAFLHWQGDQSRLWLSLHNGAFGGREDFPSLESDAAGTVRWEWNFHGDDWSVWDDLVSRPGRAEVMMLGLSAAYQTRRTGDETRPDGAAQGNVDVSCNGDGYQAMVAGSATWVDFDDQAPFWSYGALAQAGWFVADKHQLYTQYNLVHPGDRPGDLDLFQSLALGYSFLPFAWTNRWKFSAEIGHAFGALNDTIVAPSGALGLLPADEGDQTYLKLQAQVGF